MASFSCILVFFLLVFLFFVVVFFFFWGGGGGGGGCVAYTCGLLVFSCMDTNNVAFRFSPYLLTIVVHELLSYSDFTLPIFFF